MNQEESKPEQEITKPNRREYMNKYTKTKKDDAYFILMKRLNNRMSYLRKHTGIKDDNQDYQIWKILYPEFINITEILKNINIINYNSKMHTNSNLKERLHALIDEIIN